MLSPQRIADYRREGYVVCPEFLSKERISTFHAEIEDLSVGQTLAKHDELRLEMEPNQASDGCVLRRIYEPCTYYDCFREFSDSADLLDYAEQLIGPNLLFHYSKINMKLPGIGSPVEWHQDLAYYPLTNRDSVTILFYLDDATVENGCLYVLPRVHDAPLMPHSSGGFFRGKVTAAVDETTAVPVEGNAGTAILMHCGTPHTSSTNKSDMPRRTLIMSYRAADAYPIYCPISGDESVTKNEAHTRLVRGNLLPVARLTMREIPVPRYERTAASLYELQEQS